MAIVIEDGSIVANANSYVTEAQVQSYVQNRGFVLAADLSLLDPFIIAASDYLETIRNDFIGELVMPGQQALAWPRKRQHCGQYNSWAFNINLWSQELGQITSSTIPQNLINAQCQLVVEQLRGVTLNYTAAGYGGISSNFASPLANSATIEPGDGRFVTRSRLEGVVDTQYDPTNITPGLAPFMPLVDSLLAPLLVTKGRLQVRRG